MNCPGSRQPQISIHAPREGSDCTALGAEQPRNDFNPRSPRGERLSTDPLFTAQLFISIHAPREGSDMTGEDTLTRKYQFQSTLPARGATTAKILFRTASVDFNPRSPRGERRVVVSRLSPLLGNFNPRSPRGERRRIDVFHIIQILFQSTLPARGATAGVFRQLHSPQISIHAPREGSDRSLESLLTDGVRFQSTLPARGATGQGRHRDHIAFVISIHAPREGSDYTNIGI